MLLDEEQRGACVGETRQHRGKFIDDDRRESLARFVEHEQRGVRHQRAADREHLLLAARKRRSRGIGPLAQDRKKQRTPVPSSTVPSGQRRRRA